MYKKIGIITLIGEENYGNRLQNYAVQEILRSINCDTKTILYKKENGFEDCVEKKNLWNKLSPTHILEYVNFLKLNKLHIKNQNEKILSSLMWKYRNNVNDIKRVRYSRFKKFSKYIKFTDYTISLTDYKNDKIAEFDYFICGSDQVWNPFYPETSAIHFLDFAEYNQKIALSPSFGVSEIPKERINIFKKWLCDFKYLSVREEQGAEIIKKTYRT